MTRFQNPADFFMRVLSVKYPKTKEDEEKLENFVKHYKNVMAARVLVSITSIEVPEL